MATIAVCERMDFYEAMVEAHGDFIGRIRSVIDPRFGVIQ